MKFSTKCRCTMTLLLGTLCVSAHPSMAEDIVVIVHPSIKALSREQIQDLYLGRDVGMRPLDLPVGSESFDVFYRRLTLREPTYARSIWARIVFTGHGRPPQVLSDSASVVRLVAANPGTIGYIERRYLDASVKQVLVLP